MTESVKNQVMNHTLVASSASRKERLVVQTCQILLIPHCSVYVDA